MLTQGSPIVCPACAGERGKEIEWCPVPGCTPSPEGCSHAQTGWEACPDCEGTGVMHCAVCDSTAVMIAVGGSPACQTCGLEQEGQLNLLGQVAA